MKDIPLAHVIIIFCSYLTVIYYTSLDSFQINSLLLVHFCFISLEPAKGPTINEITANATAFQITWTKLSEDDSNGVIVNYEVCYQLGSTVSDDCSQDMKFSVSDVSNTKITKLNPARTYTVAVRAYTNVGPGPIGTKKSETTDESRKYHRNSSFRISTALPLSSKS